MEDYSIGQSAVVWEPKPKCGNIPCAASRLVRMIMNPTYKDDKDDEKIMIEDDKDVSL